MRLSDIKPGESAIVIKILGHGAFRKRVMEMGFVRGREVKVLLQAPLHDPVKYEIMNYEVSLRRSEAKLIEVEPWSKEIDSKTAISMSAGHGTIDDSDAELLSMKDRSTGSETRNTINVALIGNPNCGKTSLFNNLTGSSEHVGNYSGVTVDAKVGHLDYNGYRFNIVDLPGTYSLASYSPEELYVRKYLRDETPDVIVNVVDASNLERNLYLSTELIDMDRSMVIALNMFDEIRRSGSSIDYHALGGMIGVPIIPTVSRTGEGKDLLLNTVIDVYEGRDKTVRHVHVHLTPEMERSVTVLKDDIKRIGETGFHISPRYIAIKLLENDPETVRHIAATPHGESVLKDRDRELARLKNVSDEEVSETIAAEKYGFIAGALAETMNIVKSTNSRTSAIDSVVTSKFFGFPIFLMLMFITFWLTFSVGQYPMDWMESGVDLLSRWCNSTMPDGPLKDLIADGIIGGVGGVIVFLPNILILYFCISYMEDSGYMARAAFIMDKLMHKIGLHGKSFIPLVMGFGCNVPAIMGCRTIESRSSRIITILIDPFMSCSARLPIYVLIIGTFFPMHATLVFISIYLVGIMAAILTARLLRRFWFKKDETPFVMELPPYRMPTFKTSMRHMWDKGYQYLKKMGGVILVASIIVWALNYFPLHDKSQISSEEAPQSYLEMAGQAITPVLEPLGFNWRASVAALAGVPAKEIVVSTLGVLYTGDEAVSDTTLSEKISAPNPVTGNPGFTAASGLAFLIFILLYCPCIATITAIIKETGSWKYGAFSIIYNTLLAWVVAFGVYRIALLF